MHKIEIAAEILSRAIRAPGHGHVVEAINLGRVPSAAE
jgi:hypothetical protein